MIKRKFFVVKTGTVNLSLIASLSAFGWGQSIEADGTITLPAPGAVFFDATGTTHSDGSIAPWKDCGYHFDFGYDDPSTPGTWVYTGKPKGNHIGFPLAAHVYETPNTYTASVRAQDPNGIKSDKRVTIVVQDPEVYWTTGGRTTVYMSRASYTAWPTWTSNTRYMLEAGQDWTALGAININSKQQVCVQKWGVGANPLCSALRVDNQTSASVPTTGANIQFIDVNSTSSLATPLCSTDVLYLRCSAADVTAGGLINGRVSAYPAQNWLRPARTFYVDCPIDELLLDYPYFTETYQLVFMGFTSARPQEHGLRLQGCQYGIVAHSRFLDGKATKSSITIRGNGTGIASRSALESPTPANRYVFCSDNYLGATDDFGTWPLHFSPENTSSPGTSRYCGAERTRYADRASNTGVAWSSARGQSHIIVRDEIYDRPGLTAGFSADENYAAALPAPEWYQGPFFSNAWNGTVNGIVDNVYRFTCPTGILPTKAGT